MQIALNRELPPTYRGFSISFSKTGPGKQRRPDAASGKAWFY